MSTAQPGRAEASEHGLTTSTSCPNSGSQHQQGRGSCVSHADAHGARVHGAGDPCSSHAMSGGSALGGGLLDDRLPASGQYPLCGRPCAHRRSWRPPWKVEMGCENRKFVRKFVAIFWVWRENAFHKRPYVGVSQVRSWSHWFVLGAILWAFIAKN